MGPPEGGLYRMGFADPTVGSGFSRTIQCFNSVSTCVVSILTPGPIVDDTVTLRRYLPLAALGFALTMLSTSACTLATSEPVANDALPTGAWMMPVLSTRNSTLPALISFTALPISVVTVPVFGFGIRPR